VIESKAIRLCPPPETDRGGGESRRAQKTEDKRQTTERAGDSSVLSLHSSCSLEVLQELLEFLLLLLHPFGWCHQGRVEVALVGDQDDVELAVVGLLGHLGGRGVRGKLRQEGARQVLVRGLDLAHLDLVQFLLDLVLPFRRLELGSLPLQVLLG